MKRIESNALLVRSVAYGESDLVATFFTEEEGKVSAIVRGARRSTKRFGGALEPLHELVLVLEDKGKELMVLKEARIGRPRQGLTSDLDAMDAAGRALRWVRHLCPARTPEPGAWASLAELLDALDRNPRPGAASLAQQLAVFGIGLLGDVGYAFDFERCVRCGKPCPDGRSAFLDAAGGGLVCMACGGASRTIDAELRGLARRAQQRDPSLVLRAEQATELLEIVEDAMSAHTDFDPHRSPG
ncbi:MAG: DNA repair protein RecO [Deltaproteobacteria bacterium]|nr:DNA repair protein RecO [Deltaproteobacteria bacterium]